MISPCAVTAIRNKSPQRLWRRNGIWIVQGTPTPTVCVHSLSNLIAPEKDGVEVGVLSLVDFEYFDTIILCSSGKRGG